MDREQLELNDLMKEAGRMAVEFLNRRFDNYTIEEKRSMAVIYMCGYFDAKMGNDQPSKMEKNGEIASS